VSSRRLVHTPANTEFPQTPVSVPDDSSVTLSGASEATVDLTKLLNTGDLGRGWTEVPVAELGGGTTSLQGMLTGLKVTPAAWVSKLAIPVGYQDQAHRVFRLGNGTEGPYLATGIALFSSPQHARAALAKAQSRVRNCRHVSISIDRGSADALITKLKTTRLGDQRVGYSIRAIVAGFIPAHGQVIIVRKGNTVVAVAHGGIGTTSARPAKAAAAIAASRI